jgi:hypothetical protein
MLSFRFTPETGTHKATTIWPGVVRLFDIFWTGFVCVYLWKDPGWFFHYASYVLFAISFFNHANRWSGWGERDSYTRMRRPS